MINVRSFKLTSGEEIVAELVDSTPQGYIIRNPFAVHVSRSPDGQGNLSFVQWSMVQDEEDIELLNHSLISKPVRLLGAVANSYIEQTGVVFMPPTSRQILKG